MKFTNISNYRNKITRCLFPVALFISLSSSNLVRAQTSPDTSPNELKKLSIEELLDIEVTSVSKIPEKLTEVASAIQVITQQDIQRSAATNLPEALRLSPNLQVAQVSSRNWIISARGFNSVFSNKLLVMIDGRTVYSPLFAGVFWDAQSVMLEDIDKIEVISGPGATLWGANAVNGVINIVTKNPNQTQGLYVSESYGSALDGAVEARYGGKINSKLSYRVYAQHQDRDNTYLANGTENIDKWGFSQGGFNFNWDASKVNSFAFQGNFYGGEEQALTTPSSIDGQNVMGRWQHTFSDSSNLILQAYVDRTWRRDVPGTINDELLTYDLDLQHNLSIGKVLNLIWGAGYRLMDDKTSNSTQFVGFLPKNRKMHLLSSFVQNELIIIPETFKLTLGAKLQHNVFSGFEFQPSARFSLTPVIHHSFWGAASRAVRAPSRIDVDYRLPAYDVPPNSPSVAGGPNFTSEKVVSYELGYRVQPFSALSLSIAAFYNEYDDLYSVEALPGTLTFQIQNGVKGNTRGLEFTGHFVAASWWKLRGGYTFFRKNLRNKPGNLSDPLALENLGSDANNRFLIQSMLDLPKNIKADMIMRYVDYLPASPFNKRVSSYITADARIAWQLKKTLEVSVAGQNLFQKRHIEALGTVAIQRGIYGKISLRY